MAHYQTAKRFILTLTLLSMALVVACGGGEGDGGGGTASMGVARGEHTATLLPDGRVLVIGGRGSRALASTEFFDSSTDQWTSAGDMEQARYDHTVTLLPSGLLLITGGNAILRASSYGAPITAPLASAELYDPSTGKFSSGASMAYQHGFGHTATLLLDGKVLITGGRTKTGAAGQTLVSAYSELHDPSTGTWSLTGDMTEAREKHAAILLKDGKVLIVGGNSAEVYDPISGTWSKAGELPNDHGLQFTATLLRDGRVLVAGGGLGSGTEIPTAVRNADLYDPSTGEWSTVNDMETPELGHTATLLEDGRILVVGTLSAQIYDPDADNWSSAGQMSTERGAAMVEGPSGALHTATLLEDNSVLITGGAKIELSQYGVELSREGITSVEVYDPVKGW